MSQDFLRSIIKEEVESMLDGPKNALYVFDFDDTLVTDTATVYLKTATGGRQTLTADDFHNYTLKPGESMDFSEFSEITQPWVHESIMSLLRKHLKNSVILTARSKTGPVKTYMNSIGVSVPKIIAVGTEKDDANSVVINAGRKRDWIDQAIQESGFDYIEFWDDNEHNIENVQTLQKKYPKVKIVCHLVRHR